MGVQCSLLVFGVYVGFCAKQLNGILYNGCNVSTHGHGLPATYIYAPRARGLVLWIYNYAPIKKVYKCHGVGHRSSSPLLILVCKLHIV